MTIIKCKMCGGDIAMSADKTFGYCEYCGSGMTLPKIDNDQRAAAFNRGNHFRRIGEFDKALAVYEKIVSENEQDAEAHWCCALCRFGIEYVEDPNTMEWFPTCHRVSFDSFQEDVDYKAAVENSEGITKRQYIKEGLKIAEVQKGILLTSQNAQPYDIFLCYKESDAQGNRTRDSLLAQEIYYQLTEQERSVFFSRITLEDVAGTAYEPYIFAALNSAKVMIVVGTKPEYLNAPWVKNEWSRFLTLMKKDRGKLILPCYRDMDPYDLPEQLSVLQSYDMSRIGFLPDLTRGIAKVLDSQSVPRETVLVQQNAANVEPLLRRAFLFLEDGDWNTADEYCEKVLDAMPEAAEAYLGKLMAEMHIRKKDMLGQTGRDFASSANYQKALRFGDDSMKVFLDSARKDAAYYAQKRRLAETPEGQRSKTFLKEMISQFESLSGWRDADNLTQRCREEMRKLEEQERIRKQQEEQRQKVAQKKAKKVKKTVGILISSVCAVLAVVILANSVVIPMLRDRKSSVPEDTKSASEVAAPSAETQPLDPIEAEYLRADALAAEGQIGKAAIAFGKLGDYKDARQRSFDLWRRVNSVQTISAGYQMSAAVKEDGTVVTAGTGDARQKDANAWTGIVSVSISNNHTVGLKKDSTVLALGANVYGKLEVSDWQDIVAIETGGTSTFGLKSDGTVLAVGYNDNDQCNVTDWTDIVAISAHHSHTVGLKKDGTVVTVGASQKDCGQCDVSDWSDIVAVSAGNIHTVGLTSEGTVVVAGGYYDGHFDEAKAWTDIVAISAGSGYIAGLKSDGTVFLAKTKAEKTFNNLDTSEWTNIVAISAGESHLLGLRADGTMVVTGWDNPGMNVSGWSGIALPESLSSAIPIVPAHDPQSRYDAAEKLLADGETAKAAIAFGKLGDYMDARQRSSTLWDQIAVRDTLVTYGEATFAVCTDGTVIAAGPDAESIDVSSWSDIVAIDCHYGCTAGLRSDGTVVTAQNDAVVYDVSAWSDIVSVSVGHSYITGLRSDGTVVAVGSNRYGQCNIGEWTDIVAISAGVETTIGLRENGSVITAGGNGYGQCDGVYNWKNIVAVEAGGAFTLGLHSDGTVVAAGTNDPTLRDIPGWTDVVKITASNTSRIVGLRSDGTVVTAGSNFFGSCDVSDWENIVGISTNEHTVGLRADGTVVTTSWLTGKEETDKWTGIKIPTYDRSNVKDTDLQINKQLQYDSAEKLLTDGETAKAAIAFGKLGDYMDARQRSFTLWDTIAVRDTIAVQSGNFWGTTHAVKEDGTAVFAGGLGGTDTKKQVSQDIRTNGLGWDDLIAVSSDLTGLKADGTVVKKYHPSWFKRSRTFSEWKDIVAIDGFLGLRMDGTVVEDSGYLEDSTREEIRQWKDIVAVCGSGCPYFGLTADGTVVMAGDHGTWQYDISQWKDITAIRSGDGFLVGLRADGTVVATGKNGDHQCDVSQWTDIVAIAAGNSHTVGLRSNGTVVTTGSNRDGQSNTDDWSNIAAVYAGGFHTVGLKADGTLVAVGSNTYGQCDVDNWSDVKLPD